VAGDFAGLIVFLAVMTGTPGPANMLLVSAGARFGLLPALPFALGVILGMQIVAWPAGLGLLSLAERAPALFDALYWLCAGYIVWLAWRIAGSRVQLSGDAERDLPGFWRGLLVHPLNPKAWAIVGGVFTQFVPTDAAPLATTAAAALAMLMVGLLLQGAWFWGGTGLARLLAGRPAEQWAMRTLGVLTVASVLWAILPTAGR